ncbi:hypothetical protein DXG01_013299 [Tephrocybe rancida]|nr:hypothetical protein DXG01_013299 [Tephrocybe rancida]
MPAQKTPQRPQPTISSFFSSSQKTSSGKRASSPIRLDLTASGVDEEPPTKRRKRTDVTHGSPIPHEGAASQWRFVPDSPDKAKTSTASAQRTEAEATAARKRHEAFKKKLLLENNPSIRKPTHFDLTRSSSPFDPHDINSAGDESDGDRAFKELSSFFSKKGKSQSTATRKNKKPVEVGPSGQPYTPLEQQVPLVLLASWYSLDDASKQVRQLKEDNPGTLLFFEVGYKYRFFGDDAKAAAKELGMVAFEHRNFLVASIPTHRLNVHLKKLLSRGYRVGIVGQTETAALKKAGENRNAPFERKLLHLYTAATYVDELGSVDDLERHNPPPFMCLVEQSKKGVADDVSFGIITICPSTGDVIWDDFEDTLMRIELETRLVHTRPAELLLPCSSDLSGPTAKMLQHFTESSTAGERVRTEHFKEILAYTDAFDLVSEFYTDKKQAVAASKSFQSGRLMAEIATFPMRVVIALAHAIKHLSVFSIADAFLETRFFTKFTTKTHMLLAANTLTNLEIYRNETDGTTTGSLLWLLDKTKTRFGARLLRNWIGRPLVDKRVLQERVDAVEEILESPSDKLATVRQILRKLPDLAKGLCRIQYGQCTPKELSVLLPAFNKMAVAFENFTTPSVVGFKSDLLNDIVFSFPKLKEPLKELLSIVDLKQAAKGRKDTMWTDPDRYPDISNADMALQFIDVELNDQLKAIRKLLRMPSLEWTTNGTDDFLVEHKKSENRPIPDHWILHSKYNCLPVATNYPLKNFTIIGLEW